MSSLPLNKYIPLDKKVKRESGDRANPIWLVVNPKHPAVRHNIWTPALAEIQDKVYREIHTRIDTTNIYIRNAVSNSAIVPNTLNWWGAEVAKEIEEFREIVLEHKPKLLISFGAFPFEFLRRVYEIKPEKGPKYWGTSNLGDEFGRSIENFDINKTNRIPLLRRVISSGKFIEDHNYYGQNYFHYVGTKIAEKIIENKESLNIWIE
ncbi:MULTISPECIES: hypothetical protein [unclassified Desulfosporosinus]|uniref:hypothetical protein n=1 Tax=unclassified Desulfosporosinus TaxID=2633794 RepID=UPI0002239CC4|nr:MULTISPECIES: hypothetical protein [unclassified Desulfosporosinus]EGW39543.1 hypothetical protein DOT_2596 [Desulfosporosinus sp. OT]ODA38788.1 Uracil phosphoribosyltransferase [Desulfosporosinus sp. BG]